MLVDLSHDVENGMVTYPGLPGPVIRDHLSRQASRDHFAAGTTFHIGRIDMVANTGTYVDAPFHRWEDGADLAALRLEQVADLDGIVVRAEERGVDAECLQQTGDSLAAYRGKAVLLHTGWDRHWRTDAYFGNNPFLTRDGAELLADAGAALVGIDSLNIDDRHDGSRPAHSILLRAGVPVCEHLCNLNQLPGTGFRFFAVPVKVKAFGTFPVRAFAIVPDN